MSGLKLHLVIDNSTLNDAQENFTVLPEFTVTHESIESVDVYDGAHSTIRIIEGQYNTSRKYQQEYSQNDNCVFYIVGVPMNIKMDYIQSIFEECTKDVFHKFTFIKRFVLSQPTLMAYYQNVMSNYLFTKQTVTDTDKYTSPITVYSIDDTCKLTLDMTVTDNLIDDEHFLLSCPKFRLEM